MNPLLTRYWPGAGHGAGSRVFVPLCGKSLDMIWLMDQGHEVIGVELSAVAVKAFFRENDLQAVKRRSGEFMLWTSGCLRILCGDYFSLRAEDLGHIDSVYDRAALTALPEPLRRRYVERMRALVPSSADIFLLTAEDEEPGECRPSHRQLDPEVIRLYSKAFDIDLVHVEHGLEQDDAAPARRLVRVQFKLYRLTAHARPQPRQAAGPGE